MSSASGRPRLAGRFTVGLPQIVSPANPAARGVTLRMNRRHNAILCIAFALSQASAQTPWKWQDALVPDVGFDLDKAEVIRVTSLASKGKGTLREAIAAKGPKIIVFEIAG